MYERDALQRLSELKSVARPVRQAAVTSAVPSVESANEPSAATAVEEAVQKAPEQPVDDKAIEQAVRQMNVYTQNLQRALQFRIDKDSGQTVVRVLDAKTDEVIRQIPSEEILAIASRMRAEAAVSTESTPGMLLRENV